MHPSCNDGVVDADANSKNAEETGNVPLAVARDDEQQPVVEYCQVLIIGAGVCGLQCAKSLFVDGPLKDEDVIVLEARNRVGGRVLTREYKVPLVGVSQPPGEGGVSSTNDETATTSRNGDVGRAETLWVDDGAAWVHGVDPIPWADANDTFHPGESRFKILKNPILDYLHPTNDLNRVVRGNPWTRPYTVLHRTQNIAIYLQKQQQQHAAPEQLQDQQSLSENGKKGGALSTSTGLYAQQAMIFNKSTLPNDNKKKNNNKKTNNKVIHNSIRRHFQILRRVDQQVKTMYNNGEQMQANCKVSLLSSLQHWNRKLPVRSTDAETAKTILSLTSFYQHMLTCWQGFSLNEIPISQYGDVRLDPDDDRNRNYSDSSESSEDDNEGQGKSNNSNDDNNYREDVGGDSGDALWDDEEFDQDGDFVGSHCTIRGGMHKVVQALCTPQVRNRIRLEQEVVRIQRVTSAEQPPHSLPEEKDGNHKDYNVRVETKSGLVVYTKSCVVTIPVGCLRVTHETLFADTTPLSSEKQEAFRHLTMGRYKKVFLTFEYIFWPAQPAFLGMILAENDDDQKRPCNPLGTSLLVDNLWARDGYPCIEAILAGDQAVWATHKADQVIRDTVLDFLQAAMNIPPETTNLKQLCSDCHITRWEEDPFCRGAYAGISMGGSTRHCEALRSPEWGGCLRFGGDASSFEFEGSVPAAIFSGRYTAQGICDFLGFETEQHQRRLGINGDTTPTQRLLQVAPDFPIYEEHKWKELPQEAKEAAMVLGFSQQMWDRNEEPHTSNKDWRRLTSEEKSAAAVLGYNKERWNKS
ncbi:hypothetical protein ACA910_004045 [Epithemia clementina (nom. ined.)]